MEKLYSRLANDDSDNTHNRQSEDCERLLSDSNDATHATASSRSLPVWAQISLIGVTLVAATLLGIQIDRRWLNLDSTCTKRISHASPVIEDVDITYDTVKFNGSFFSEDIFRQPASPEVDAAWEALGVDYRPAIITEDEAAVAGLDPDQVQVSQEHGGGYMVNVEGLHHLHCLNLLRKSLFYNYDYYKASGEGAFGDPDKVVHVHVSHCLDILRQQLMCTVDTGVLGQWWVNPDHPCKNFDAVRQWAEDHQAPEIMPEHWLELPDADTKILPEIP